MVFTLFGLLTRRASHKHSGWRDGCRGKLRFLYPSNKILLQFSWTQFPVNHNKWPSKHPTLTRDAIQYETKRDFKRKVVFLLLLYMFICNLPLATFSEYYLAALPVSWHFIQFYPTRQIFLLRLTAHVQNNIVSCSKQQYVMYLYYCKGRFRVGVGVNFNKTQSNR